MKSTILKRTILGLDIGGTKTAILEGSPDGGILQRIEVPTEAQTPFDKRFPAMADQIWGLLHQAKEAGRSVVAVSVSIGGPLKIEEGVLLDPPHLPGWHFLPLKASLSREFPQLPVYVEHDGNAGALAEFYFGAGKDRPDLRHLIFLTFGTGLGAGFILNGRILHGASDTAGEVGHWRLSDKGPFGFGKHGSWEGFASGKGLVQLASEMYPSRWNPQMTIRELVEAMLADDPDALAVAREAGTWMGRGIALLIDALNPQIVVLGSLSVALGERILEPVRKVVAAEALLQAREACEILPSVLGPKIGDVAALMAALTHPSGQFRLPRL